MRDELKPIRTEADYEKALAEVEHLWGAKRGTRQGDRLDVLATLIDAYETEHYPIDPPDPIEAIKFRMEQQGLSRKDLEPLIGTRTRVTEGAGRSGRGSRWRVGSPPCWAGSGRMKPTSMPCRRDGSRLSKEEQDQR